jgi:hypothetical protein
MVRVEAKIAPIHDKRTGQSRQGVMLRVENIGHRSVHVDQIDFLVWRRGVRGRGSTISKHPTLDAGAGSNGTMRESREAAP